MAGLPGATGALRQCGLSTGKRNEKRSSARISLFLIALFAGGWMWHTIALLSRTSAYIAKAEELFHQKPANLDKPSKSDSRKASRVNPGGGKIIVVQNRTEIRNESHASVGGSQEFPGGARVGKTIGHINARVPGHNKPIQNTQFEKKNAIVAEKVSKLVEKYPSACRDKESFLRMIFSAGDNRRAAMYAKNGEKLCKDLPTQTEVNEIHGSEAIVYGMETCEAYRELLRPENNKGQIILPKPRVAGLYHTGTNALTRSFDSNIRKLKARTPAFSPYEVPWGKHLPPAVHRLNHTYPPDNQENRLLVLPIVLIRDPFFWMQSMCKARYDAKWTKPANNRCPSLIRFAHNQTTYTISAKTHQTNYKKIDNYTSLADMWSDWYSQYLYADYPRLIIRFEDTLYRLDEVVKKVRECIGVNRMDKPFQYHVSTPKMHGSPTDFVGGLKKYASTKNRHRGLNEIDRKYAQSVLNPELLRIFKYKQVPLLVPPEDLKEPFIGWRNEAKDKDGNPIKQQPGHPHGIVVGTPSDIRKMIESRKQNARETDLKAEMAVRKATSSLARTN